MAAMVIYQIIQHNEAVSKSHDIYSRINSSPQAIKMLSLSSAALLAPLHTLSLHNDWLHFVVLHVCTLQESLISNMSPFILKHQRFVTGTWRICLQRNSSGQTDLNLAHWKTCHYLHFIKHKYYTWVTTIILVSLISKTIKYFIYNKLNFNLKNRVKLKKRICTISNIFDYLI